MLSAVPRLVAAPDKFRGTAAAAEVAAAAAGAARAAGWEADEVPLADGGEGTLEAVGGEVRVTTVAGPLGAPVDAQWRLVPAAPGSTGPTAVIEMARAAGRALLPRPTGDDPLRAGTAGVGELVLAAVRAGARRVVVGVGGSATTDGGWGAVEAVGSRDRLDGAELVVACDVRTTFRQAAEIFGPQKGATPDQVALLSRRLDRLAERYRRELGVDVERLPGGGAAGGLAGGLAALGARVVPGFDLVAELVGLEGRLAGADLVMTGEGCLDATSFEGKVVGGVVAATAGRAPVLCVVGSSEPGGWAAVPPGAPVTVVDLSRTFGTARARRDVLDLVAGAVAGAVAGTGG